MPEEPTKPGWKPFVFGVWKNKAVRTAFIGLVGAVAAYYTGGLGLLMNLIGG